MVRSPLTAARATFALKAAEWFRRGRLLMVSPVHGDYRHCQAEIPLILLSKFPEPAQTFWYPAAYRARILAAFIFAVPVSTVIGAPLSGFVLGLNGVAGIKGWQWVFIVEGIPSILLGLVTWFYLTDTPAKAKWLDEHQKRWLLRKLESERAGKGTQHGTLLQALRSPKVLLHSLVYFGFVGALYGMQFWLPQIVKAFGLSNAQTGLVSAVPYLFASCTMIV